MRKKLEDTLNYLFHPQLKKSELPAFVSDVIMGNILLGAALMLASVVLSVYERNFKILLVTFCTALLFTLIFYMCWYLKFANNEVIYYDATIERFSNDGKKSRLAASLFKRYVRKTYEVQLVNDTIRVQVVMKDLKHARVGDPIRIYTTKESITERGGEYLINNTLHVEKITL